MIISFRRADLLMTNKELADQRAQEVAAQKKENLQDMPIDDIESNPNIAIVIKEILNDHLGVFESIAEFYNADEVEVEELEWKSRDGFWSHVNGAFGITGHTTADYMISSGSYPNRLGKKMSEIMGECHKDAVQEIKKEFHEDLKDMPDDKINYSDLYNAGLSTIAERLSEFETEYAGQWEASFVLKVFYYNPTNRNKSFSTKKPEIYVSASIDGFGGEVFGKSFMFSTLTELRQKLDTMVGAAVKELGK